VEPVLGQTGLVIQWPVLSQACSVVLPAPAQRKVLPEQSSHSLLVSSQAMEQV
jgi:hypothetical protein